MAIDVHNPKLTWATLITLGTLVFYSGGLTYKVNQNSETNATQWRYINSTSEKLTAVDKYVTRFENIAKSFPAYEQSSKELSANLMELTYTIKNLNEQIQRDKDDKVKSDHRLDELVKEVREIKIQVTRIEESQKK